MGPLNPVMQGQFSGRIGVVGDTQRLDADDRIIKLLCSKGFEPDT